MTRLTSSFWVQAYIKRLNLMGVPAFVVSHGDDTAGSIIVKVNKLNGDAILFERSFSLERNISQWSKSQSGDEKELDELLSRQLSSCLLYTSPSPRDSGKSRMPSSA